MYQNMEFDPTEQQYLRKDTQKTSQLYLLLKNTQEKSTTPSRPVISANWCPIERIFQFIDHFLNHSNQLLRSVVIIHLVPLYLSLVT